MTSRSGEHWGNDVDFAESYANGRISNNPNLLYDAAGNILDSNVNSSNPHEYQRSAFDSAGRRAGSHNSVKRQWLGTLNMVTESKHEILFDGDGHPVVQKGGVHRYHVNDPPPPVGWQPTAQSYQVWSSVLGASLMSMRVSDNRRETKVFESYLRRLASPECGQAFRRAGLEKPFDAMRNGNLLFAARELLDDPANNATFGISEKLRSTAAQSTANATAIRRQDTISGQRGIVFIHGSEPFREHRNNQFSDFVAHETAHALGEGQHWAYYQPLGPYGYPLTGHDLSGWQPHYERIVNACGLR